MDSFEYNYNLLKTTRENKKISAQSIAADLCLAQRHIESIENNSSHSFHSASIKFSVIKKYAMALGLELEEVIEDLDKVSKCFLHQGEFKFEDESSDSEFQFNDESSDSEFQFNDESSDNEFEFNDESSDNENYFDIVKSELKALPTHKKIQYSINTALTILALWVLIELFTNVAIASYISSHYQAAVDSINYFREHWPNYLKKYPD